MRTTIKISAAYARPFGEHFIPMIGNEAYTKFDHAKVLGLLLQAKRHIIPFCQSTKRRRYS